MSGIWDILGFMISEDREGIWAVARSVARSAQGRELLGAVKLGITNPSLTISSSLAPCLRSALHNEPRLRPRVPDLSCKVCCCNVLCTLSGFQRRAINGISGNSTPLGRQRQFNVPLSSRRDETQTREFSVCVLMTPPFNSMTKLWG